MIVIIVFCAAGALWAAAARSTWVWIRDGDFLTFNTEPEQWGFAVFVAVCWLLLFLVIPPLSMHLMTRPFVPLIWLKNGLTN